jgi:hypothetical protein
MERILKFKGVDDDFDFKCAINGVKMWTVLEEIDSMLRNLLKHGEHEGILKGKEKLDDHTLEWLRNKVREIREDNEVNFEG